MSDEPAPAAPKPRPDPKIILITDPSFAMDRTVAVIRAAAAALGPGVLMVQLRDKERPAIQVMADATRLREITRACGALLCLNLIRPANDLLAFAKQVGVDGVHAPCERQQAGAARAAVGWASVPTHTDADAFMVASTNVDVLLVSPIFLVPGKLPPRGVGALASAKRHGKKVFALGGITPERAEMCARAGAHGVAVIRGLLGASDPAAAALELAKPFLASAERV